MDVSETGWNIHTLNETHGYAIRRNHKSVEWKVYVQNHCVESGNIIPHDLTPLWLNVITFGVWGLIYVALKGNNKSMLMTYNKAHTICTEIIEMDLNNG